MQELVELIIQKINKMPKLSNNLKCCNLMLLVVNVLFIVYYVILTIYNRPSQDDWLFNRTLTDADQWQFLISTYMHHSGRLLHYIPYGIYNQILPIRWIPIVIPMICYVLTNLTLFIAIKLCVSGENKVILNVSTFLTNIFLFINFEFSCFYWSCASFFLLGGALYILLYSMLVNFKESNLFKFELVLLSLAVSISSEYYSLIFAGFIFLTLCLYKLQRKSWASVFSESRSKWMLIVIILLTIGTAFVVLAPGNYQRVDEEVCVCANTINTFMAAWSKNIALYFYLLIFKLPYLLLMWVVVANLAPKLGPCPLNYSIKQISIMGILLYVALIFMATAPMAYIMSGFGYQRAYTTCIIVLIAMVALHAWCVGAKQGGKINHSIMCLIANILLSLVVIVHIIYDKPIAQKYAQAHDQRTSLLIEAKNSGREDILLLSPLPNPHTIDLKYLLLSTNKRALYYKDEISTDAQNYSNKCLSDFFNLKCPIVLDTTKVND